MSGIDPFSPEFVADPHAVFGRLRGTEPVAWVDALGAYLVTDHDLVVAVLEDPATFSNRRDTLGAPPSPELAARLAEIRREGWAHRRTIADEDPPMHEAFRSVVAPFFTPSRMRAFRPALTAVCEALVDRWDTTRPVDLVAEFADPLPLHAISVVLGLPTDDEAEQHAAFARWRDAAVVTVGSDAPTETILAAEREVVAMQHFLARRVERAGDPADDVFAALRDSTIVDVDGGERRLTMEEILTICRQIFVGGIETTTKALAEAMLQLAERPELFAQLGDEGRRRRIVEESLRLSSPAQGILRTTTCDVELGGILLPAGSRLFVMFAAANRDPSAFADPDVLDPDRGALAQHLAFGRGLHTCLGAALARSELGVALEVLGRRIASYRVVEPDLRYPPSFLLRGPSALHLDVTLA